VGEDYRLMLDSMWAYTYDQAIRVGRAIERLGYYWYEDPLPEDDIYNYVKLKRKLDIPIMATEYSPGGFHSYGIWITSGATDYLRGDVAVKGGITACLKAAHLAEAFQMNFELHHGGNSLNNVANLHIALAIPNTEYFEVLLPDQAQKYGLEEDLTVDAHGFVHAIDRPGLGAHIDFDLIQRKRIAVLS
jgi:L-alanine-DL-glutamate epimerase-like enolase superfamily enzyme